MGQVAYPFGSADYQTPTTAATLAISIQNLRTIVAPTQSTGAVTYNLSLDAKLPVGADLIIVHNSSDTGVVTFGTGFTANTMTGVAGKTQTRHFIYDGTSFKQTNAQIN